MTNLLAFTAYYPDATLAGVVLENKGINPDSTDQNEVSSAWGMLEKAKGSDYSQGRTSEKISAASRKLLIDDAKAIFKQFNVVYIEYPQVNITGVQW
jgi:hypothetical protein